MHELKPGLRIAILSAMRVEIRPIVARFALSERALGGNRVYRGTAGGYELHAAVTSIGTRAAAAATERLLEATAVDHVFVVGVAGGVDPRLHIGDLVNPEEVVDERGRSIRPTPVCEGAPPRGRLLTTDTLHDAVSVEPLRRQGFVAVDMETAAIGAVAEARGIPFSVFRAISDRVGDSGVDPNVVRLAAPDGAPNPAAVARYLLRTPWRIPALIRLARGMNRAVAASTGAVFRVLQADR